MTSSELVTLDQVEDILVHGGELDIVSSDQLQEDIVRRILSSETVEEAFGQFTTTAARDLDGIKINIHGVAWAKSAFDDGPGVYALLDVTRDGTDEHEVVSMGGRSLMASFAWAQRNKAMPFTGVLRQEPSRTDPSKSYWTFKLA